MTDLYTFFSVLGRSSSEQPLGVVVVVGCGAALDWAMTSGARQIVVVDPNPDYHIEEKAGGLSRVWAVVSPKVEAVPYWRYNLPLASGPAQPTAALHGLFPGLQELEHLHVQGMSAQTLLQGIVRSETENNLLFVDTPAAAEQFISAVETQKFSRIFLHLPEKDYFQGAMALPALLGLAQDTQYSFLAKDQSDPDFPWICLGSNPDTAQICDDLRQKQAQIQQRLDKLSKEYAAQISSLQEDNLALRKRVKGMQDTTKATQDKYSLLSDAYTRSQDQIDVLRSLLMTDKGAA